MTQVAPGWYDDGTGRLRWWDGAAWSGDVLDPAGAAAAATTAPADDAPRAPEEFPWMREAAERERIAAAGTAAIATPTVAAPADPIRSLRIDRTASDDAAGHVLEVATSTGSAGAADGVDPVVAWARQQAAAQQAGARPEAGGAPVETPRRPRRRVWPWALGGAVLLAGAGAAVLAVVQLPGDAVDPAAASVVEAYNELWAGGECASAGAIGTEAFIADLGWDDCALLADSQRAFLRSYEDYRVTVEETVVQGGVAWVDTSERYLQPEGGEEQVDRYRYELVRDGDGWLIDSLSAR